MPEPPRSCAWEAFVLPGLATAIDGIRGILAPLFPDDGAEFAEWTAAAINDLPDACFAVIEGGGEKDVEGKTTPRSLRHFPYKDASGKVDLPHLRNALARLPQSNISADMKATAKSKLVAAAKANGVGEYTEDDDALALAETIHTPEFLAEFRRLVTEASKNGAIGDAEIMDCMKKARAHAGGAMAAKNRQMRQPEAALSEFTWGVELAEVGKPIQIMRTGEFTHPEYGKFAITEQDLAEIKANFDGQVRGQDIPIDVDHDHEGGAVGWMKSLSVQGDTLWATPEWTDQGAADVGAGKYRYFSPHFGPWKDPESGDTHRVVLMSGAITNFPFLKGMQPISLNEFAEQRRKEARVSVTVEDLEKRLTEAEARVTAADEAREKALTEAAEAREKALTEASDREKLLTERIQRMERDGMVKRLTERIRGNGNPNHRIIGDEDKKVALVVKLAETFGEESEEVTDYLADQEAVSEAVRASGAFNEVGSTREGRSDADGQYEAKLKEIMAANPTMSRGVAAQKVLSENPALYTQTLNGNSR